MKKIIVLGSTGSIGRQTLEVVRKFRQDFKIIALGANRNIRILSRQIKEFKPKYIYIANSIIANRFKKSHRRLNVITGEKNLKELISKKEIDLVVNAVVGSAGILPTFWAAQAKKDIALANKESLVAAGSIITKIVKKNRVNILPVDSEHSAVWQCLLGEEINSIKRIILTCSGGPFYKKSKKELENVKPEEAIKHPRWKMGKKISIDSATLMNKGFEVIEAKHLFNLPLEKIKVVIHPQSIVHSMVEFNDGSVKALLSEPDMRLPIQNALTYPQRKSQIIKTLDFRNLSLDFFEPDFDRFPCFCQAIKAIKIGGTMPAVLNAANEIAVDLFLKKKISFLDISKLNKFVMNRHQVVKNPTISGIVRADKWAKKEAFFGLNKALKDGLN